MKTAVPHPMLVKHKAKLVVCTFEHEHGADALVYIVPASYSAEQAESLARKELEEAYGKEDMADTTERYGGVSFHHFIGDGSLFKLGKRIYSVRLVEETK